MQCRQHIERCLRRFDAFVHAIVATTIGEDNWKESLSSYLEFGNEKVSPVVGAFIRRYAPAALALLAGSVMRRQRPGRASVFFDLRGRQYV